VVHLRSAATVLVLLGLCAAPPAYGQPPTRATPALLADLARDYSLSLKSAPSAHDLAHVRVLLKAAARLEPRNPDVQAWLYELAIFAGDPPGAMNALALLCELDPTNESAFAHWLDVGPRDAQTAEKRKAWLESLLSQQRPPASLALVHAHLGRLAFQRLDRDAARKHLDEARRLHRDTPEIAALAVDMLTRDSPAGERVSAVLEALRFNPTDVERAWRVGVALDELGFFEDANLFFEHALRLHRAEDRRAPIPVDKMMRLALNCLARNERPEAGRLAGAATDAAQGTLEPALLLLWMASTTGDPARVEFVQRHIRERLGQMPEWNQWPVNILSQVAWYSCLVNEELPRALAQAQKAAERAPNDPFVQRVLGWALAANGMTDEARAALAPLAETDAFAAAKLIEVDKAAGRDTASEILGRLKYIPPFGPAREQLEKAGLPPSTQPVTERYPDVVAALQSFDRRVLEFDKDPAQALLASVAFENAGPSATQPWSLLFTITNTAAYPVTLGADWMVNPVFLLSFRLESDEPRDVLNLFTVDVDRARVLAPGESLKLRRNVDIGPMRRISHSHPTRPLRVTAFAVFDPQRDATGEWRPSAAGQYLKPASLDRKTLDPTPEAWNACFAAITRDDAAERFAAIESLAMALGEYQRYELNRAGDAGSAGAESAATQPAAKAASRSSRLPRSRPPAVPVKRIEHALRSALFSNSWESRARALHAMQSIGLNAAMIESAEKCLSHEHWLVRLLAVRLLARQGKSFLESAQRMSAKDPDELVREMSGAFVERWNAETAPGSAPATQPNTR
jgi:tetratricopeptide (TPR) repeat protein